MNGIAWYRGCRLLQLAEPEGGPAGRATSRTIKGEFAEGMKIVPDALKQPGYRLPTEAEWEYACRAGAVTSRYYGRTRNCWGSMPGTRRTPRVERGHAANSLPNELGLFDMLGNVYEWCQEQYYLLPGWRGQYDNR